MLPLLMLMAVLLLLLTTSPLLSAGAISGSGDGWCDLKAVYRLMLLL
jgi:hypothetical protein